MPYVEGHPIMLYTVLMRSRRLYCSESFRPDPLGYAIYGVGLCTLCIGIGIIARPKLGDG